jgi:hypothetical protein
VVEVRNLTLSKTGSVNSLPTPPTYDNPLTAVGEEGQAEYEEPVGDQSQDMYEQPVGQEGLALYEEPLGFSEVP